MSETPAPTQSEPEKKEPPKEANPIVNPVSDETLAKMRETMPTNSQDGGAGLELEEHTENMSGLMSKTLGFNVPDFPESNWEKGDIYSILERTELEPFEFAIFGRLIQRAEHGLGGAFDRPHSKIGERLVNELRARRSKYRGSLQEFENMMTTWLRQLRIEETRKQEETSKRMVGAS